MKLRLRLLSAVLLVAAACITQPANADTVRSDIEAANTQFSAAAAKGDGAGLAALYATDGQVLPAGSDPIKGAQAIQKFWQGALDSGIRRHRTHNGRDLWSWPDGDGSRSVRVA